jgi:membrane protease YdiL (CAAX protease family)
MASDASKSEQVRSPDDRVAVALRGFGPLGILAIIVILATNFLIAPLNAILVLVWAKISRTPWREIGYVRPKSWTGASIVGIVFGVAFKLVMKAIVMPLFGAPPINQAYHFLAGNTSALPWMLYAIIVRAGFGEETVYRGWMFERFGKLFGPHAWTVPLTIVITSALFASGHLADQGLPGAEQAMITGVVFGMIFVRTGSIFLPMVVHVAFDLAALALIYWDVEPAVAHFIFK